MKILIIYGTTEGQTRKIARYMEEHLQETGNNVVISDAADDPPSPDGFDVVVLGGSMHMMKYQNALGHYVHDHAAALNRMPSAFFSVSLGIATLEEKELTEARRIAEGFVEERGWKPGRIELIAGALKYTQYDWFKRMVMRMIASKQGGDVDTSRDHEYTNWEQVKTFCDELVAIPVRRSVS